ncbi:MAG TPA: polysaccharide deacetylase family protein [Polyangiaceae bacterium]|jgi:peptidoglycan/xylan/chitin deacetylase (PgdA/CDA1 family)|nr:polysaccharide deacetylase family protein [Polyangiaceae bacterium]
MTRLCAVSVDLDEIDLYRDLHGLPRAGQALAYRVALPRAAAFARSEGMPLTLFAVGRDLQEEANARALQAIAGHEVENHSYAHRYDLTRLSLSEIEDDVRRAQDVIGDITGRRPRGFRAPGYTVSDALFEALEQQGLSFDSSVFPSPPYYLAKAAALAVKKQSVAVLDTPRVMTAPASPYRPARPWYRRGGTGLLELPIAVTPGLRLPFIGTALTLAGVRGARALARMCARERFINLELHAIDFLDAGDGLDDLGRVQPDVTIAAGKKQRAIGAALDVLRAAGYRFVTLGHAADLLS